MDASVATCMDDIRGGGSNVMMVTTNEDDFFLGVDEKSGELCFSWEADNESKTIIVGDGDCAVLSSPPLMNGGTTTKTLEDLSRGLGRPIEQISRPKSTKPQTKVYNFKDLFSPSRLTADLSHPSNNDRGRVRMDTDMEPLHQDQAVPEGQAPERKKQIRWTSDEQKQFLMGVMVFGDKDKWRNIRKHFVWTKTSSQFGSHVQKFKKRKMQMNRKRHTINDIRVDDITRQDVARLVPKKWRQNVLSAMDARSNGEKTLVPQYPSAALQENASGSNYRLKHTRQLFL